MAGNRHTPVAPGTLNSLTLTLPIAPLSTRLTEARVRGRLAPLNIVHYVAYRHPCALHRQHLHPKLIRWEPRPAEPTAGPLVNNILILSYVNSYALSPSLPGFPTLDLILVFSGIST